MINGTDNENGSARRATRKGPKLTLRFRTKKELEDVSRVAREKGLSMNTYVLTEVLGNARNYLSYKG